jgi:hypothetical protein
MIVDKPEPNDSEKKVPDGQDVDLNNEIHIVSRPSQRTDSARSKTPDPTGVSGQDGANSDEDKGRR